MKKKAKIQAKTSKKYVRISPRVAITLPPIVYLAGRKQARERGIPFSRHVASLIEQEACKEK